MGTIEREGRRIHFEDTGPGPETTVILGHSFLCSGEMWRCQVPALAEERRVINVDYPGHGRSGPLASPVSLYDLVGDTTAVLDAAGVRRAVWAGLSVGGMVALRAALEAPERVQGLVLVDTDAGAERPLIRLKYKAMGLGSRLVGLKPFVPAVLPLMFGRTTRVRSPDLVAEWRGRFESLDLPSILRLLEGIAGRDSVEGRLGEITAPTLVLVGDEDETLPLARSERIRRGISGAILEVVPGSGHLAALERPEEVTRAMLEFLDAL